jgi:hypothetical protein
MWGETGGNSKYMVRVVVEANEAKVIEMTPVQRLGTMASQLVAIPVAPCEVDVDVEDLEEAASTRLN